MKSLKELLLDVDGDTNFDEKMIITQFFNSIESQQHIIKYLQGLIEKSSEPIASFNVVKNDRFSDSMYVVFPKKQTANGYHMVFIKQAHRGIRLWRAYGDTILDQILVSASEAGYGLGPRSNYIYKVPESMRDLFEKIINKSVRESILDDDEIMSKYEELGNMKNLSEYLIESTYKFKKVEDVETFLAQFPDDATSWKQATDEVRDLARLAADFVSEYERTNINRLDFKTLKTPADWNSVGKAYIMAAISGMSNNTLKRFLEELNGRF